MTSFWGWMQVAQALEHGVPALKQAPLEQIIDAESGESLEFGIDPADRERELEFEIPALDGMDELFVVRASIQVSALEVRQEPLRVATPKAMARVIALTNDDPRVGGLRRVVIRGLVVEGAPVDGWLLQGANTTIFWSGDQAPTTQPGGQARALRVLVRLAGGNGFGPPAAAAPAFPMPGASGLYGPALGGASIWLGLDNGRVDASITFDPPLESRSVELRIVVLPELDSLPNESVSINWRAEWLDAIWVTRLRGLEVDARLPGDEPSAAAPVASYPGLAAAGVREIDFSAAARSLLRKAYAERGLSKLLLHCKSGSIGELALHRRTFEAEYRRRLVAEDGVAIHLRGGVERTALSIPPGLQPARFTLTFDGTFGPAALVAAADWGELDPQRPRSGYRLVAGVKLARWLPLTVAEASRRLLRVSVEGFGRDRCELLLALHRGDPLRIGTRYGDPVALDVPDADAASWHRAELGDVAGAPPHPAGVWVVAEVSRGAFWWVGELDDASELIQRSPDAGASWDLRPGRLRTQVHQEWLDALGEPLPVAIPCVWSEGQLRADIRPADQLDAPAFRGVGLSLLGEHTSPRRGRMSPPPIDRVPDLGDTLELGFDARRDVDFRILDAVMTYNPWLAKG